MGSLGMMKGYLNRMVVALIEAGVVVVDGDENSGGSQISREVGKNEIVLI